MNDVVKSILFVGDTITVASLGKNAGAGGVFLALACDYAIAQKGVVLNPHYETLGHKCRDKIKSKNNNNA